MRHKMNRERKRKPIPERFVLVGNVLHYVSEQLILKAIPEADIVEQAVLDFNRRVAESVNLGWNIEEIAEAQARVESGAWRLAELYAEKFKGWELGGLIPELHLFKFYENWALEGYIDVAMMTESRVPKGIYDVKTGSSHKRGQLEFYSVLCEAYFGKRTDKFYWIEPLGRGVVEVVVTDEDHDAMKQRIVHAAEAIMRDDFPTEGFPNKCGYCSARDWCPATDASRAGKFPDVRKV